MKPITFLIAVTPLAAVPKIITGQIWFSLLFDFIFLLIMGKIFLSAKNSNTSWKYIFLAAVINIVALIATFNPGLQTVYNALHGYRSTGLYMLAILFPLFARQKDLDYKKMLFWMIIVATASSINALRQYFLPFDFEIKFAETAGGAAKFYGDEIQGNEGSFRPFSTFVTSVHLALFLSFALVAAYFNMHGHWLNKIFPFVILAGIIITLSRTSYIAILAMITLLYVIGVLAGKIKMGKTFIYLIGFAILVGSLMLTNELIMSRVAAIFNVGNVSSFQSRYLLWAEAILKIQANPFGFGTGSGSWAFKDSLALGSDSGYLKILLEFGWIGGFIVIFFLIFILIKSVVIQYSVLKPIGRGQLMPPQSIWLLSCSTLVITNIVQMFTNQTLEAYPNNLFFWLACGFMLIDKGNRILYYSNR